MQSRGYGDSPHGEPLPGVGAGNRGARFHRETLLGFPPGVPRVTGVVIGASEPRTPRLQQPQSRQERKPPKIVARKPFS